MRRMCKKKAPSGNVLHGGLGQRDKGHSDSHHTKNDKKLIVAIIRLEIAKPKSSLTERAGERGAMVFPRPAR
jgi:hypothetical protein